MLGMIKRKAAVLTAITVIALAGLGAGIAEAAGTVNVPNANGQLTGTVDICVNTANEGQQYVELQHPAPGNCAAGYLQYTANQPAASASSPAPNVNSESFASVTVAGPDTFFVRIPPGSHITGTVTAVDLDATALKPDAVAVTSVDNVTGAVKVTYSAGTIGHTIQVTYDYQL